MAWHEVDGSGVDVTYFNQSDCDEANEYSDHDPYWSAGIDDGDPMLPGWYWAGCAVAGCLPEGEWCGPFATEADALADVREQWGDASACHVDPADSDPRWASDGDDTDTWHGPVCPTCGHARA